jgi:tetratricopeptide (TPR) repeat protein
LENGAEVNAQDERGETPLHCACWFGHDAIVSMLLKKGANSNARKNSGETPLHFASIKGSAAVASLLLGNGADVDAQDNEMATALHTATFFGHDAVVSLLLQNGANVNVKREDGDTPLHKACRSGRDTVALLLLIHDADPSITNDVRHTPLQLAQNSNNQKCIAAIEGFRQVREGTRTLVDLKIELLQEDIRIILTCPISHDIMKDPVSLVPSGSTVDKESICTWLLVNETPRDPLSNEPLDRHMPYAPNLYIRNMLTEYLGDEAYVRYDDNDFLLRYQALWDAHDAERLFNVGVSYQDDDQYYVAEHYYQRAAALGHAGAQYNLAMLNEDNHERLLEYLELAAGQNHPEALYYLGTLYYDSDVVVQNLKRAREYFQRAAAQGHSEAQEALENFPAMVGWWNEMVAAVLVAAVAVATTYYFEF